MEFYLWAGFFFSTLIFYTLGRDDGEKNRDAGLYIWTIVGIAVSAWIIARAWYTR